MAAVGGVEVIDLGFIANEALTIHRFVKNSAAGTDRTVDLADTAKEAVIGVAQHEVEAADAAEGAHANIRIVGISTVEAGAAVTLLSKVQTDSVGRAIDAVVTVGNEEIAGVALMAASAAGDLIAILLTPGNTQNTATT